MICPECGAITTTPCHLPDCPLREGAVMTDLENEISAAIFTEHVKLESEQELVKLTCELQQLRFQNMWLRDANKALLAEVRRLRDDMETVASGSFV
jgi:hypothetical protein